MTPAASHVLLLGWDDSPRTGEQLAPPVFTLVQALAPHTPLAIVLPRRPITLTSTPNAHVTVLSELTPDQIKALPTRPDHPAGWQPPAAPYLGSTAVAPSPAAARPLSTPAEPYIGRAAHAAPAAADATTEPDAARPVPDFTAANAPTLAGAQPVGPTGGLLNRDDFESEGAEPEATEAQDLAQPQDKVELSAPAIETPAAATAPTESLPDSLAALQLTPAPDADLNHQVIQYARLASRQVVMEEFTVIYATDWPTWLAAMEIRQQTGRPLVLHVHGLAQDRNTPADRGWIQELERLAMRRADLVLASSEDVAQRLRAAYPVAAQNLQVVAPTDTTKLNSVLSGLETAWARR